MRFTTTLVLIVIMAGFYIPASYSFAQDATSLVSGRRAELERELQNLEAQIAQERTVLEAKQRETVSLERDVAILTAKINEAKLAIKARNLVIERLSQDIRGKETTIGNLSEKLVRERQSLAQILRKANQVETTSLAEFALASSDLSEFFSDLDSFDVLKRDLQRSAVEVTETRAQTAEEKIVLEDKRSEELELRQIQELQAKKIQEQENEKKQILSVTKGQENAYKKVLQEKEKSAASIRAELFQLRGAASIPFEKAYELALIAQKQTGIRPAFLLGIIAEESNLGENVGTGSWRVDMHPTRDRPVFEQITRELGLDPDKMPVSKKAWYGWGGAMGPAQFIPSTWVLYKDRIAELTGHKPPNPWDPYDAFMASAVLLKDNGGAKGTRAAERLAALRYLAGWKNAEKPAYAFYGDEVMELADKYQRLIDILNS